MTDRSIARSRPHGERQASSEEKRKLILAAAVRVFARDGYHTSRVGDIAEEAGIAHGLLYHYFSSKDEVLATVFRENWGQLLQRFHAVELSDEPADEKLRGIAKILLRTWRNDPALVTVMVREVARSPHLQEQVDEVERGVPGHPARDRAGPGAGDVPDGHRPSARELGVLRRAWRRLLTGWVLGQLPDGEEEVARAERTVVEVVCGGLTAGAAAAV